MNNSLKFGNLFTFTEFKDRNGEVKDDVFILTPVENDKISLDESNFTMEKEASDDLNDFNAEVEIDKILGDESYDEDALPF